MLPALYAMNHPSLRPATSTVTAACGSPDHRLHRRLFLQGSLAGAASIASFQALFSVPAFAQTAQRRGKRCILLWLCGAPSQFETWDPKPGRPTGGPFGSIPTNLPGVHVSSLMPKCATIMDKLTVIRSMSTEPNEHFQAIHPLKIDAIEDFGPSFCYLSSGSFVPNLSNKVGMSKRLGGVKLQSLVQWLNSLKMTW